MSAASPQLRRFALSELPIEPWRNGAGSTRVVASRHDGDELQWRISVADVVGGQAFSAFHGLDRTAVLIKGAGVDLVEGLTCLRMRAVGDHVNFPGEWMPTPELVDGPVQLWNVMTRRSRFGARVLLTTDEPLQCSSAVMVVLVLSGLYAVQLNDDATALAPAVNLQAGEGVVIAHTGVMTVNPARDGASALTTYMLAE